MASIPVQDDSLYHNPRCIAGVWPQTRSDSEMCPDSHRSFPRGEARAGRGDSGRSVNGRSLSRWEESYSFFLPNFIEFYSKYNNLHIF